MGEQRAEGAGRCQLYGHFGARHLDGKDVIDAPTVRRALVGWVESGKCGDFHANETLVLTSPGVLDGEGTLHGVCDDVKAARSD